LTSAFPDGFFCAVTRVLRVLRLRLSFKARLDPRGLDPLEVTFLMCIAPHDDRPSVVRLDLSSSFTDGGMYAPGGGGAYGGGGGVTDTLTACETDTLTRGLAAGI
tara:strand:+ start:232 stop:546 length:315 start_codon:yes stop_codon:yes gene_type:complete